MIWKNSRMSTLYYSADAAAEDYPCVVKIDDKEILVEYESQEGGIVKYSGANDASGHFSLTRATGNGSASLHMFPGAMYLDGYWIEDGYRGMWRIELEE